MRTWLLVTSLAISLPLAACGDDTGGAGGGGTGGGGTGGSDATTSTTGDTTTTTTTTGTTTSTGGGGAVETVDCAGATIAAEITTDGLAFSPETTTIAAGDVIRFTPANSTHDMTADDGSFGTSTGSTECLRFDEPGDYPFHCSVHGASMAGTVTVE